MSDIWTIAWGVALGISIPTVVISIIGLFVVITMAIVKGE